MFLMTPRSASKHCRTWKAITRGKVGEHLLWKWNVSFLPAGKCVCAASMHTFQMMMMKERFKSAWRWKRCLCSSLDSLLSIQVSLTHSSVIPPFHLSVLAHHYSNPRSAVRSQSPRLNGVIFTQRRPLIGSQWCSKDFDGEIETNRANFTEVAVRRGPALTDFLVGNLILNIQGFNRQMNALQNAFSHSHTLINWRSNLFQGLHFGLFFTCRIWETGFVKHFIVCLPSGHHWRWKARAG